MISTFSLYFLTSLERRAAILVEKILLPDTGFSLFIFASDSMVSRTVYGIFSMRSFIVIDALCQLWKFSRSCVQSPKVRAIRNGYRYRPFTHDSLFTENSLVLVVHAQLPRKEGTEQQTGMSWPWKRVLFHERRGRDIVENSPRRHLQRNTNNGQSYRVEAWIRILYVPRTITFSGARWAALLSFEFRRFIARLIVRTLDPTGS